MVFKGSGVALVTPFDEKNNVNFVKLKELIEFQIKNSTDAIIICGTTGEASTLSPEEYREVIRFTIDTVNHRIPVIAGTGSNNTEHAIQNSIYAKENGAEAVLVVTPYYNKCTQKGLYLHFKKIADAIYPLNIILYDVPSRTNIKISPDTVYDLSKIENICGIKEASSDIYQISKIASLVSKDFAIYSGNDDEILPILAMGGSGVISVIANIFPQDTHNICSEYFNGNIDKARYLQYKYLDLMKTLFIEVSPMPIKEVMNQLDYNVGKCRLPLCDMEEKNIEILKKSINEVI